MPDGMAGRLLITNFATRLPTKLTCNKVLLDSLLYINSFIKISLSQLTFKEMPRVLTK